MYGEIKKSDRTYRGVLPQYSNGTAHEQDFFPIANNRRYLPFIGINELFVDLRFDILNTLYRRPPHTVLIVKEKNFSPI